MYGEVVDDLRPGSLTICLLMLCAYHFESQPSILSGLLITLNGSFLWLLDSLIWAEIRLFY